MSEPSDKVPAYSWYALGVLFLVYLFNFVDRQILSILANDIKGDLGLDDAQLGFLYGTAFAIFYALFGIPLGRLADSWSRTRLLALGLSLWSAMTALSGFARNFAVLTVARVGVGVGEASCAPAGYALVADYFPARMRGTAIGIFSAGLFLGSGLSLLIGGLIVAGWNDAFPAGGPLGLRGWQAAFVIVGLPGLLLAVWVMTLHEPGGRTRKTGGHPFQRFFEDVMQLIPPFTLVGTAKAGRLALMQNLSIAFGLAAMAWVLTLATGNNQQFWFWTTGLYAVASWAAHLRRSDREGFDLTFGSPAFMSIVAAYGCVCFVGYVGAYWAAPYAERTFALSKTELGLLIGAPSALGGFLGVIAGGRLADWLHMRHSAGRAMIFIFALLGATPVFVIGYTTTSVTAFVVCHALGQFATSSALGAGGAATQSLVLPRMRGLATAIYLLGATMIGLSLGPFMAGFVSERTGNLGTGVLASLAIVPVGLVAVAIALRTMPRALERLAAQDGVSTAQATRSPESPEGSVL